MRKGPQIGDIIHQNYAECASVIMLGNTSKLLRSCSVPELQINTCAINKTYQLGLELYSYCRLCFGEFSREESLEDVRLAGVAVTSHDYFKEIVVVLVRAPSVGYTPRLRSVTLKGLGEIV